jgi:nucleotide-binding universal stress UspA family protein
MFDNVLVGVDGRPSGDDAVALARQPAAPGARVTPANIYQRYAIEGVAGIAVSGAPRDELTRHADDVNLLIVGSRGYGQWAACCTAASPAIWNVTCRARRSSSRATRLGPPLATPRRS